MNHSDTTSKQKLITSYKPCYLFELDSVRKSEKEIAQGVEALTRALMKPEHYIVLPFNQLGDSKTILRCFMDKKHGDDFIKLFEIGRIKVNRFGDTRTLIDYLIGKMEAAIKSEEPTKEFVYSALDPFEKSYFSAGTSESNQHLKLVLEQMLTALRFNDASTFSDAFTNSALFPTKEDQSYLARYLQVILRISVIPTIYVGPKPKEERTNFNETLPIAINELRKLSCKNIAGGLENLFSDCGFKNNRSVLHQELKNNPKYPQEICHDYLLVIDCAYNHAVRSSIIGLDFDEQQFRKDIRNIAMDFLTEKVHG